MPNTKKKLTPSKVAPKRAVKKNVEYDETPDFSPEPMMSQSPASANNNRKYLIIGLVVLVIAVALYSVRSLFIVATVNGEPVTRLSIVQQLEKEGGKRTLQNVITKMLVLQEAKKRNITMSDKEITDEYNRIKKQVESQGQTLDQILTMQGLTVAELRDQIKTEKLVEKMFEKEIAVSQDEVQKFITDNASSFPEGTSDADKTKQAESQLRQQKMSTKVQGLVDDLQKKAKITYFMKY